MRLLLHQFFSWWHSQTLSVRFFTWLRGEYVGSDCHGNSYYVSRSGRRWVVYAGEVDASSIASGWHGWIHHRTDDIPSESDGSYDWELPHKSNKTGTDSSYSPDGVRRIREVFKFEW